MREDDSSTPTTIVATMTGPTTIITSMWLSMIAVPSASVTSGEGEPRRSGHGTRTAPLPRATKVTTATPMAARCECTMLIGISAGFIPMNMTM